MDIFNQFRKRLCAELVNYFTLAELTKLAQFDMGTTLANVVFVQTAFESVAFEFVTWSHRHARLRQLVKAAADSKPDVLVFQALLREFDQLPAGATPTAADFGRFANKFTVQLRHLEFLQAYKKLHDILHELDGVIETFQDEANVRATANTPIPADMAEDLQMRVAEAREWRRKTEHPSTHQWVERFATIVGEFLGLDTAKHDRAFRRLEALPAQELGLLNSKLTDAAHRVELDQMGELLDWQLDGLPDLARSVSDFRRACVSVRDLTAAHDICQFIDRDFRAEDEVTSPDDLDSWEDIYKGLKEVRVLRPNDPKTARALTAAEAFRAGGSFADLSEKFVKLFALVDKELLEAIPPLLSSAFRLSASLGKPQ